MQALAFAVFLVAAMLGQPARSEIMIGAADPMTGKLTWIGEQLQRGTEMAVADLNDAGGVLGQQLRVVTADDFCDPVQAVAAANKLVNDGVAVVIGHYCSGASIPASEVYANANIPLRGLGGAASDTYVLPSRAESHELGVTLVASGAATPLNDLVDPLEDLPSRACVSSGSHWRLNGV